MHRIMKSIISVFFLVLSITEIVAESHNILVMGMLAIGAVGLCILFERKNYEKWCREGK